MRVIPLMLLFMICFAFIAIGQESEYVFRVQIAASAKPISKSNKIYKDFEDASEIWFEDGYYRYFVGEYESYHEAGLRLEKVKSKGYKGAYPICIHDGKRLTVDEAIMLMYGE